MNEIVSTAQLKELIARSSKMDPAFVQVFVDELVGLVMETVLSGEDVVIEGLGTFRRVTISSGKYTRLVFFADERMKEGVNAPFAQFEPIVLVEHFPDTAEESNAPITASAPVHSHSDIESDIVAVELKEIPVQSEKETESEEPNASTVVSNAVTDSAESVVSTIQEESAMDKREEEAENREYQQEMKQVEEPVDVSNGNGEMTERVDQVLGDSVSEETNPSCETGACQGSSPLSSKRYGLWAVVILLAVCIVGTLVYFFVRIYQNEKSPEPDEQIESVVVSKNQEQSTPVATPVYPSDSDTIPPVAEQVQESSAPATSPDVQKKMDTSPQVQQPEHPQTTIQPKEISNKAAAKQSINYPLEIVLKPGQRLTLLALRYYGHKAFWVYIYEANKSRYADPQQIPAGATLRIPSPAILGINPNDSASVHKALDRAAQILK